MSPERAKPQTALYSTAATPASCALIAGALSVGTLYAIRALPTAGLKDALAVPGALLGTIGSVAGLYDVPSGAWANVCITGNIVTYAVLWWIVVRTVVGLRTKKHE